jgi:hypothetical protein
MDAGGFERPLSHFKFGSNGAGRYQAAYILCGHRDPAVDGVKAMPVPGMTARRVRSSINRAPLNSGLSNSEVAALLP